MSEKEVAYLDKMRGVTDINFNNIFRKKVLLSIQLPLTTALYFPNVINLSEDHSFLGNCIYKRSRINEGI